MGTMYCGLFEDFFGLELANYLWGTSGAEGQTANMFIGIGLSMLGITAFLCALYYIILDHPRLSKWWGWSIFWGSNALVNLIVGWQWVLQHYHDNKMMVQNEVTGENEPLGISTSNIFAFGLTNMFLAMFFFFLFSCVIKWWSTNCRRAPF